MGSTLIPCTVIVKDWADLGYSLYSGEVETVHLVMFSLQGTIVAEILKGMADDRYLWRFYPEGNDHGLTNLSQEDTVDQCKAKIADLLSRHNIKVADSKTLTML